MSHRPLGRFFSIATVGLFVQGCNSESPVSGSGNGDSSIDSANTIDSGPADETTKEAGVDARLDASIVGDIGTDSGDLEADAPPPSVTT